MRIAVILALPIEYNTSSNLRCGPIISEMYIAGHFVCCYMPQPDIDSKYYSKESSIQCSKIVRYGKVIKSAMKRNASKTRISLLGIIKNALLSIFRRFDVFGRSLLYLPYRKEISDDIARRNYDVLVSFSDPMVAHMIGIYCKKHNKIIRYIQQWGDPLANDRLVRTSQPFWFQKMIEKALIAPADVIYYVSPITLKEQKELFPYQASRMFFLPTPSLDYGVVSSGEESNTLSGGSIVLGYYGSYNSIARDILPLYGAVKELNEAKLIIIGDSDVRLKSTENIEIIDRVPHEELKSYIEQTDVIVCLMNRSGNQIPGKIYHDASLHQDILVIVDGEYGDQIQEFFAPYEHYTFVKNNREDIIEAINKYIQQGIPKREKVSDFSAKSIAERILA